MADSKVEAVQAHLLNKLALHRSMDVPMIVLKKGPEREWKKKEQKAEDDCEDWNPDEEPEDWEVELDAESERKQKNVEAFL